MNDFELVGPDGTDLNNDFIRQYRDALKSQYDSNVAALNQNKRNNDTAIMSGANRAGLMYSNFPQRAKIQNEASYLSKMSDLNTTYQTGLDKLRGNAVDTFNKIKDLEDQIKDLNDSAASAKNGGNSEISDLAKTLNDLLGNQDKGNSTADTDSIAAQKEKLEGKNKSGSNWVNPTIGGSVGSSIGSILMPASGIWGPLLGGLLGSEVGGGYTGTVSGQVKNLN